MALGTADGDHLQSSHRRTPPNAEPLLQHRSLRTVRDRLFGQADDADPRPVDAVGRGFRRLEWRHADSPRGTIRPSGQPPLPRSVFEVAVRRRGAAVVRLVRRIAGKAGPAAVTTYL